MSSKSKSCSLDPIPSWLLKQSLDELTPAITNIISLSLQNGRFLNALKFANITPLIKKQTLDPDNLRNYRPIANLSFLGKTIERAAASQIQCHLATHNLAGKMQSAYRKYRSVETALLRVYNDLLLAADEGREAVLVLLDYSAAFDTIDHHIMLQRLHHRFGINDSALEWFTSYFANRQQSVLINQISSPSRNVNTGVPQGSVLGPLCFTMYTSPLEDLIASYGVSCMIYADDIQLYVTMTEQQRPDAIQRLESCLTHIQSWSTANKLKLNSDKTEVIHITSQFKQHTPIESLRISDCCTRPVTCARDLGTIITSNLRMQNQHMPLFLPLDLHKIGQIRNFLDKQTTEKFVHAFISCRLDFCNSLLHCIPDSQTSKLQRIQNSAARLLRVHHLGNI